jgi:DNA replication protein DnaC
MESEIQARADNRLKRRIRDARFPLIKTLEGFDYEAVSDLDRRLVRDLIDGSYIQERKNVIYVGKTGTGKTHLATAIELEACRQGVRTRFATGAGMVNELTHRGPNRADDQPSHSKTLPFRSSDPGLTRLCSLLKRGFPTALSGLGRSL